MANLTARRLEKITPLLQKWMGYVRKEPNAASVSTGQLFQQIEEELNLGNREVHDCMGDLLKHEEFAPLGAMILESGHFGQPRAEAKIQLAKAYGASSYHYDEDLDAKRAAWFQKFGVTYAPESD